MSADDARTLMYGTTPGPWVKGIVCGFGEDSPDAVFDVSGENGGVGEAWTSADARLMSAAPDLAASVIALEGERDEARAEVERMRANLASFAEVERLRASHAARAEVERLRSIVEGRTTPPTDAEITAHAAAGGSWVVGVRPVHTAREAREVRDVCERRAVLHEETPPGWPPYRWLAFDDHGRPCAWPTVTP